MYTYEYTDDTPRDFPTLGIRDVQKGQVITSESQLNSPFLKEITQTKSSKKVGEE